MLYHAITCTMVFTIVLQSYENQVWNRAIVAGSGLLLNFSNKLRQ